MTFLNRNIESVQGTEKLRREDHRLDELGQSRARRLGEGQSPTNYSTREYDEAGNIKGSCAARMGSQRMLD